MKLKDDRLYKIVEKLIDFELSWEQAEEKSYNNEIFITGHALTSDYQPSRLQFFEMLKQELEDARKIHKKSIEYINSVLKDISLIIYDQEKDETIILKDPEEGTKYRIECLSRGWMKDKKEIGWIVAESLAYILKKLVKERCVILRSKLQISEYFNFATQSTEYAPSIRIGFKEELNEKEPLSKTNPYLKDREQREKLVKRSVKTSSDMEKSLRDPKRIPKVLKELKKAWTNNPDLGLTQVLLPLLQGEVDPFYLEDDVILERLREFNDVR
jgi:hypothetical protein